MTLVICAQQVVRVVLVDFGERHDTRTSGQQTAADRWLTNQVSAYGKLNREVARHARHPCEDVGRVGRDGEDSRGCYEGTASVEFKPWKESCIKWSQHRRHLVNTVERLCAAAM